MRSVHNEYRVLLSELMVATMANLRAQACKSLQLLSKRLKPANMMRLASKSPENQSIVRLCHYSIVALIALFKAPNIDFHFSLLVKMIY